MAYKRNTYGMRLDVTVTQSGRRGRHVVDVWLRTSASGEGFTVSSTGIEGLNAKVRYFESEKMYITYAEQRVGVDAAGGECKDDMQVGCGETEL